MRCWRRSASSRSSGARPQARRPTFSAEILSARRPAALARLAADRNNLRAALAFASQEPAALALAARIVGHSGWWWYFDDALREGEATVAALLPQLSEAALSGDAVLCWIAAARVAFYSGAPALARERAARAVALLAQAGDTEARAHAQMLLALATNPVSNSDADAWMAQSLDAFTAVGEPWGIALGTQYRGVLLFFAPDAQAESERFLLEGRARFDALGDPWGSGASWLYLGLMAARRGDPDEAERCLLTTLVVSQRAGDAFRTAATLHRLARLSAQRDDLATAQAQARAAATLRLQRGHARACACAVARSSRCADRRARR
jgi:tetratricopeptide (TPR) repeat protein